MNTSKSFYRKPPFSIRSYLSNVYFALRILINAVLGKTYTTGALSYPKHPRELETLLRDLDTQSISAVFEFLLRTALIFNVETKPSFTAYELEEQKKILNTDLESNYIGVEELYPEVFYYHNGLRFLTEVGRKYIEGKDVIDGGGFIGDSAIMFSKKYDFKTIHTFEPVENNFFRMKKVLKMNTCDNIKPHNMGLGEKESTQKIALKDGHDAAISPDGDTEIELTSIDSFADKGGLRVGCIKLDIEGYEQKALLGATHTIKRDVPVLLISIYHSLADLKDIRALIDNLAPETYDYIVRSLNPFSPYHELMLIAVPKKIGGRKKAIIST